MENLEVTDSRELHGQMLDSRTVLTVKNLVNDKNFLFFISVNREFLEEVHLSPDGMIFSSPDGKFIMDRKDNVVSLHYFLSDDHLYDSITIPEGVNIFGDSAFEKCRVKEIIMPDSVTEVHSYAFRDHSDLENVRFSKNLQMIYYSAFAWCANLKSIHLPDTLGLLQDFAFAYCYSLKSVHIPDGLGRIGDNAFAGCDKLEEVSIPESVQYFGENSLRSVKRTRINRRLNPTESTQLVDAVTYMDQNKTYCTCVEYNDVNVILPKAMGKRERQIAARAIESMGDLAPGTYNRFDLTSTTGYTDVPMMRCMVALQGYLISPDPKTREFLKSNCSDIMKLATENGEENLLKTIKLLDSESILTKDAVLNTLEWIRNSSMVQAKAILLQKNKWKANANFAL